MSSNTTIPIEWAVSISLLRASGVPVRYSSFRISEATKTKRIKKRNEKENENENEKENEKEKGTVATGDGKEVCDLIAKAGVVCVLHDGHELDAVVAEVLDPWEDVVSEVVIGGDLALWRRDSDWIETRKRKNEK